MNFHPQEVVPVLNQVSSVSNLQIDDLNNLIDSLKRREENIIQLLDYNLKFKGSSNHIDIVHLRGLYIQLNDRERKRVEQEDLITKKYENFFIVDDYQKKLINKMKNKILQLNASAHDKLIQLGIFQQTKKIFLGITNFEETLTAALTKIPTDIHFFLTFLVENSRQRFVGEIDQDVLQSKESVKTKNADTFSNNLKSELCLPKVQTQKGVSPISSAKAGDDNRFRDNIRIRNIDPGFVNRKDLSKLGRTSITGKSVDSRPSFDFKEESLTNQKFPNSNFSRESSKQSEPISVDDSHTGDAMTVSTQGPSHNQSLFLKSDALPMSINLNSPIITNEKNFGAPHTNSSRISSVKKVKISSNKKSMCLEEAIEIQQERKEARLDGKVENKIETKQNKDFWVKNYDILKIEYQPLPTATKKETKKLLLEKVYKELFSANTDIKRTMKRYRASYLSFVTQHQVDTEESSQDGTSSPMDSERLKTSQPKHQVHAYSNFKPKAVSSNNPNQRDIFSVDNMKEMEAFEFNNEAFGNIFNTYSYSNGVSPNKASNKEGTKKQISQKFLVLPKLNLFPEPQNQGLIPCWPSSAQGSKSILKPSLMPDFVSRLRHDKTQKIGDRQINPFSDVKLEQADQEILSTSLNTPQMTTKLYNSYPNKSGYPLSLQPLESTMSMNR